MAWSLSLPSAAPAASSNFGAARTSRRRARGAALLHDGGYVHVSDIQVTVSFGRLDSGAAHGGHGRQAVVTFGSTSLRLVQGAPLLGGLFPPA